MPTVANQKVVKIHREKPKSNFLQIKNENWQNMIKETHDYPALALYLYLSANADNYTLELSPAHIIEAMGLPKSTFYKKLQLLIDKGYLVEDRVQDPFHGQKNLLHFYEVPQKSKDDSVSLSGGQENLAGGIDSSQETLTILLGGKGSSLEEQKSVAGNREIDIDIKDKNRYNKDKNRQWLDSEPSKKEFIF